MPRVLITGGEGRATLAACRALASAGYDVDAVAGRRPAATHWSRACARSLIVPDPGSDAAGFVEALVELASAGAYDVLIPGSDSALLKISEHRERIGVLTGLPDHDAVLRSLSRQSLAEASSEAAWTSPQSVLCQTLSEAGEAAERLGYPVMVKTPTALIVNGAGFVRRPSQLTPTGAALEATVAAFGTPVLVQGYIPGKVYSLGGVRGGSDFLALTCSEYERTWPPEAGNVSASHSVEVPDDLRLHAAAMIDAIGWKGLFEIELVRDESGAFIPIDFNPRVYGSLELSTGAGAPLAPIWCDWLLQRSVTRHEGRGGVRYRWEDSELQNLLRAFRSGRMQDLWAIVRPRAGTVHALFRLSDPAPLLARALAMLRDRHTRRSHDRKLPT
jgi:carbamoylphosphate synthase large subunit